MSLKTMSTSFSSNDSDVIHRKIPTIPQQQNSTFCIEDIFEVERCVEWIKTNNFSKVALQFPDSLLGDAATVALELEKKTNKQIYILGDTSYQSCCVDEIAAEHVLAEGIVHYGHSCLSSIRRLPVLYVFGKQSLDVTDVEKEFRKLFSNNNVFVIILYEVTYSYSIDNLQNRLTNYKNVITSQLHIPENTAPSPHFSEPNENSFTITKCGRRFSIPHPDTLARYSIFYIGSQNQTLTNLMLAFNHNRFFTYDPYHKTCHQETLNVNQYLRKRYFYIEKAKDAKIIGILVGTLGVSDYLTIIKHLRDTIKAAGKKSYTLVVGKLNSAKLANFPEIELFVHVACPESSLIDCHDYYQPIITPYELEVACHQARTWTGDYITDFGELLPGAVSYLSPSDIERCQGDVSLVTGKMRSTGLNEDDVDETQSTVATRSEMEISNIHSQAAGEFLAGRMWGGLEQRLGETPVAEIRQGRTGIASQYDDEEEQCDNNDI